MKDYYTLADLNDRSVIDSGQDKPARLAVIGFPVGHSKSPAMQQAALDRDGRKIRYIRVEATPQDFHETVTRLQCLGFIGANITVPHKTAAASLCSRTDNLSQAAHATNTLVFEQNGKSITGFNTDGPGFARAIREEYGVDLRDLKIVLLGAAGGAGIALAHTCASNRCEKLTLVNRSQDKLLALRDELAPAFVDERRLEGTSDRLRTLAFDSPGLNDAFLDADLIVNATGLGLSPTDPSPVEPRLFQPWHLVYDLQTHQSAFQTAALEAGARVADGLSMLIWQGALSYSHWFGSQPDIRAMKKAIGTR